MRAGRAILLGAAVVAAAGPATAQESRRAVVVRVRDIPFPAALDHPVIGDVAEAGGIGLLVGPVDVPEGIVSASLEAVTGEVTGEVLVMVIGSMASDREPDWLVLAAGPPAATTGGPAGLTSDTTRVDGIVAGADVGVTVRDFLGRPVPDGAPGSLIRIEGEAPTDLYDRAVDHRRVAAPVGLVVLALGIGSLVVGLLLLLLRPIRVVDVSVAIIGLAAVAGMVALVPASVVPSLEAVPVTLAVAGFTVLIAGAALLAGRRDHAVAVAVVAGVGLALLALDGLLGWPTEVTPLLGGGAVLGVRFYGLGNSAAGIVLSGAVLVAALLRPWPGVALIAGAALFAGLPFLGADLGGGVTLLAAAGLWYGWRVRGRMDLTAWGVAAGVTVLGAAALVVVHAAWPQPTHVARAVEAGGLVTRFADRLVANVRATTEIWPAWLTVAGLPVWLLAAWRRAGPFREMLDPRPRWRGAVMILAAGGMIGYVANDSFGTAAVAFVFVSAAMVYPALRERRWTSG